MNYYKNNIRHVKGDTYSSALVVEGLGQPLDSVYFTCRDSANDNSVILFEKSLADGGITIVDYDAEKDIRTYAVRIDPFDTRTLQIGTYFYDIQITVNSDVFTIMKGSFILEQDASKKGEPDEPEIIIQIKAQLDDINGETVSVEVFDKLDYLSNTKALMKDSLNLLGSEITDTTTFRSYVSKINDIYNEYPRTTETGTDFNITAKKGIMKLQPKGNIEQATYTGKNFMQVPTTPSQRQLASYNKISDNSFSLYYMQDDEYTRSPFVRIDFDITKYKPNTQYTISKKNKTTGTSFSNTGAIRTYINGVNGTVENSDTLTFTTPSEITSLGIYFYLGYNNTTRGTGTITFYDIQIEEGSTATDYEPYVGGVSSPNPDYPQEVKTVTGDNTIKITGKNLFDKNNATYKNGYYKDADGVEQTTINSGYLTSYVSVKPNTTYTIQGSFKQTDKPNYAYGLYFYDINKGWISKTTIYDNPPYTFTTPNNCYFIQFQYRQDVYDENTVQIEESGTATTYEPYKETICSLNLEDVELCKIGDYQDYFYKENDNWYKKSYIEKTVLNGSDTENWNKVSSTSGNYRYFYSNILDSLVIKNVNKNIICNKLNVYEGQVVYNTSVNVDTINISSTGNSSRLRILLLYSRLSNYTVENFTSWLSTNNVTVYYVLATPTDTQITDTTLINQLNALQEVMAIDGTNVISSEYEKAPVIITATALMKGSE